MSDIWKWTATETAAQVKSGAVSCQEVVESHLSRMEAVEPVINSIAINLADEALETAKAHDANRASAGETGPLHGVPATIKINVDQIGYASSNGVAALAGRSVDQDSPLVANMREDGAVFIGRSNSPEFALRWFTSNDLHGLTKNPWDTSLTPGGSSGGGSASVAAGVGCIAHGNDLGGSLRYPANVCGLATIRPSMGRVAAFLPSGTEERPPTMMMMSSQGPMARTVADVRLALTSMAKRGAADPSWTAAPNGGKDRQRPYRVGVALDPFGAGVSPEVERAVETARKALEARGHQLVDISLPKVNEVAEIWGTILFTEVRELMGDAVQQHGSEGIKRTLAGYDAYYGPVSMSQYVQALANRGGYRREWNLMFEDVDAVLMPVSAQQAFPNEFDFDNPDRIPELVQAQKFLHVVNVLGLPSAAVPTGVEGTCPQGVQIVGAWLDEDVCLDLAEDVEAELGTVYQQLWDRL